MPDDIKSRVAKAFSSSIKGLKEAEQTSWYDYEGSIKGHKTALVIKTTKGQLNAATLTKLLDQSAETGFKSLIIVTRGGYFETVFDYLANHTIEGLLLYILKEPSTLELVWSHKGGRVKEEEAVVDTPSQPRPKRVKKAKKINIGVFTSKGGVGKTTVSAHLAGALTIMGYESALIDLDPQSNLKKLIGDGGIYIKNEGAKVGSCMSVLSAKEWDEDAYKEVKAVVCDCNPELDKNPTSFVKKFDFCIIPITLNPLGINKHASVVERTIKAVRDKNKKAKFLILINQYEPKEGKKNKILLDLLKSEVENIKKSYNGVELIDPANIAIRYSSQLFYWGMHTLTNDSKSELAFEKIGARSIPKDDFFALAEFIAHYTSLEGQGRRSF